MKFSRLRKFVVPLGVALLLGMVLAAAASAAERRTVNLWAASLPGDFNQWVTQEFPGLVEEAFPDLRVEVTVVQSRQELEEKRLVAKVAGVGPDVFHESDNFFQQSALNGSVLALDRYLEDWEGRDDLILSDAFMYQGKVYGIPYAWRMTGLAYWEDLLDAAGVSAPQTWDELLVAARHLTIHSSEPGWLERAGLATHNHVTYDGIYPLQVFVEQLGSSLFSADLRSPQFNTPEARRALEFAQEMYQVAYPAGARPTSSFTNRGAAMHFWYSVGHAQPVLDLYSPDVLKSFRFMKIPGPTGPADQIGIMGGWGWAINPDSPNPDDAWRIIAFLLSEEIQWRFLESFAPGVLFGARRSMQYPADWPFYEDAMLMAVPPITTWGPVHPLFGEVINTAQEPIYQAVKGELPIGNALEEAQRLVTALFDSMPW